MKEALATEELNPHWFGIYVSVWMTFFVAFLVFVFHYRRRRKWNSMWNSYGAIRSLRVVLRRLGGYQSGPALAIGGSVVNDLGPQDDPPLISGAPDLLAESRNLHEVKMVRDSFRYLRQTAEELDEKSGSISQEGEKETLHYCLTNCGRVIGGQNRVLSGVDHSCLQQVRVVVNVFQLSEGWDVTCVYVVVPLRAMATFQNAIQTMGRGLRLPFGMRVGDPEVDQLDVLCFGKETFEKIVELAIKEFGKAADGSSAVSP